MESMLPETRKFSAAGMRGNDPPPGQSWECAVLWGSLVLEASPALAAGYRLPGAALTWNSMTLQVLLGARKYQPVTVAPRRVN